MSLRDNEQFNAVASADRILSKYGSALSGTLPEHVPPPTPDAMGPQYPEIDSPGSEFYDVHANAERVLKKYPSDTRSLEKPLTKLSFEDLPSFVRTMNQRRLDAVHNRMLGRPDIRKALVEKIREDPVIKENLFKTMTHHMGQQQAGGLGLGGLALGTVGQTEEALVAEGMHSLLDIVAAFGEGDFGKAYQVFEERGRGPLQALLGESQAEVGDVLVRMGFPEPVARVAGLGLMTYMNPLGRLGVGPREVVAKIRKAGQTLLGKGVRENALKAKHFFHKDVLGFGEDFWEYLIEPTNTKHITTNMLKNPNQEATGLINNCFSRLKHFTNETSAMYERHRKIAFQKKVSGSQVRQAFQEVVGDIAQDFPPEMAQDIQDEFLRAGILRRSRQKGRVGQLIANPDAKFDNLIKLKNVMSATLDGNPTGQQKVVCTRAKERLTELMREWSPEYAEVSNRYRLASDIGRQFEAGAGKPGRLFGSAFNEATGELIEGSRVGTMKASEQNIINVLDYWSNKNIQSTDAQNLMGAFYNIGLLDDSPMRGNALTAQARAIAAGAKMGKIRPSLAVVSIGGFGAGVVGSVVSANPAYGAVGAMSLMEASPRGSLTTLRMLQGPTPRSKALQRMGAMVDESTIRALGGRQGGIDDVLEAPAKTFGDTLDMGITGVERLHQLMH